MVTDKDGYIYLIKYLTENLSLFENVISSSDTKSGSIIETIEEELARQIIDVCNQNQKLTFSQRNAIVIEVDSILYDFEEILSAVLNNSVTNQQEIFIKEFSILIKNLFDEAITSEIQKLGT